MQRLVLAAAGLLVVAPALAQPASAPAGPWRSQIQGGAVHQFETDLDEGGSFSVTRAFVEAGVSYAFSRRDSVGLTLGYGRDAYGFDAEGGGLAALDPWDDVHAFSISAPLRYGVSERISLFAAPTLRWRGESGADFGDALSGGSIVAASYRVSDRLRVGGGFGAFTGIEENADIFPVLLIDWQVTDSIAIESGAGLGATRGPGLTLSYTGLEDWRFTLGGRYDTYRFRLDDDGPAPDGVGEDRAVPLFLAAAYEPLPIVRLSAVAGLDVAGSLQLEDRDGADIADEDFDAAPFLGATFRARF